VVAERYPSVEMYFIIHSVPRRHLSRYRAVKKKSILGTRVDDAVVRALITFPTYNIRPRAFPRDNQRPIFRRETNAVDTVTLAVAHQMPFRSENENIGPRKADLMLRVFGRMCSSCPRERKPCTTDGSDESSVRIRIGTMRGAQ
jgi:hypothetical protein